jgi:hypothetical protein
MKLTIKYNAEIINELRNKYPQLTETDLSSPNDNMNDILRMIEYKLHKTKKEMRLIIAGL